MIKVSVVGKCNHLHWVENCVNALSKMEEIIVKPIFVNKQGFIKDISRNLLKTVSRKTSQKYLINAVEAEIKDFNPDLIIVISPFLLPIELSIMIGSFEKKTKICWVGDNFNKEHTSIAENYNYIYYTDSHFVNKAKEFYFPIGEYLPLAVNEDLFYNSNKKERTNNLLFIGSPTSERLSFINSLEPLKVKLVGRKWKNYVTNNSVDVVNKNISINDVAKEYNLASFVLNIKDNNNVVNGLNMRTFEAIACGCCLIQDYVSDIELNFDSQKELIIYKDKSDIIENIKKFNKDKTSLKKIIENGQKRVALNHTYTHRMNKILQKVMN